MSQARDLISAIVSSAIITWAATTVSDAEPLLIYLVSMVTIALTEILAIKHRLK